MEQAASAGGTPYCVLALLESMQGLPDLEKGQVAPHACLCRILWPPQT